MKALVLVSGGLDSLLALLDLRHAGVLVEGVHYVTGFNHTRYAQCVRRLQADPALPRIRSVDVRHGYLRQVAGPLADEGTDPCVACRSLMLADAAALADAEGFELLATGEVVGQHARSQSRAALATIERAAGVEGRVVRPLSAAFLPCAGGPAHERLASGGRIQGRSRRAQRALARGLGVPAPPVPSGGCCRLGDPRFLARLRDARQHGELDAACAGLDELELLALGRHFRVSSTLRVVVARDEVESGALTAIAEDRPCFSVESGRGAVALALGNPDSVGYEELGGLAVRYSAEREVPRVRVVFRRPGERRIVLSRATREPELDLWRI